jgi:hypothetical protein
MAFAFSQTITWAMLDQLRNPKEGFEDVISIHFKVLISTLAFDFTATCSQLCGAAILEELRLWEREAEKDKFKEAEEEGGKKAMVADAHYQKLHRLIQVSIIFPFKFRVSKFFLTKTHRHSKRN